MEIHKLGGAVRAYGDLRPPRIVEVETHVPRAAVGEAAQYLRNDAVAKRPLLSAELRAQRFPQADDVGEFYLREVSQRFGHQTSPYNGQQVMKLRPVLTVRPGVWSLARGLHPAERDFGSAVPNGAVLPSVVFHVLPGVVGRFRDRNEIHPPQASRPGWES